MNKKVETKEGDILEVTPNNTIVHSQRGDFDLIGGIIRYNGRVDLIGGGRRELNLRNFK